MEVVLLMITIKCCSTLLPKSGLGMACLLITSSSTKVRFTGASPGSGRGGGKKYFFQIWKFACRKAMRFARVVRGMTPEKFF